MQISIVFTGGTIGSRLHENGIGTDGEAPRELLLRYREESGDETVFHTTAPYTLLSENLEFYHIALLTDAIKEALKSADGVIVTHGTDTLPYTAAALSYTLGLISKPVVLVSSNYILSDTRANGVENFRAAVDFLRASREAHGVFVSYKNAGEPVRVLRAARLLAHLAPTDTVNTLGGTVATWENGMLTPQPHNESGDEIPPLSAENLGKSGKRVLFLRAHPDMCFPTLKRDIAAVLLEAYHSGTLPTATKALRAFAKRAKDKGVPVFVAGITGEATYESANAYHALGITPLPPLSPVAAYLKLCLALANDLDPNQILPRPLGGDL
ncbi:MAG: asparaginase [Clostridia bacterium]|nr:asparaginase [Clostridia bacterium]